MSETYTSKTCDHCYCITKTGLNGPKCKRSYQECCKCGDKRPDHLLPLSPYTIPPWIPYPIPKPWVQRERDHYPVPYYDQHTTASPPPRRDPVLCGYHKVTFSGTPTRYLPLYTNT